jgi:hypothetical protein
MEQNVKPVPVDTSGVMSRKTVSLVESEHVIAVMKLEIS